MNKKFKAGDLVYYPQGGTHVFQLEGDSSLYYPLSVTYYENDGDVAFDTFTLEGFLSKYHKVPLLFHATEENKDKLEALYGVEFEVLPPASPSKPTSKEIIKALRVKTGNKVPCWVSNATKHPTRDNLWVFIESVKDGHSSPYCDDTAQWSYATPFNPVTLEPITELPNE